MNIAIRGRKGTEGPTEFTVKGENETSLGKFQRPEPWISLTFRYRDQKRQDFTLLKKKTKAEKVTLYKVRNIAPVHVGSLKDEQKLRREKWAGGRYEVETVALAIGPKSLENEVDASLAAEEILAEVVRAERDGCDAVTIDCFVDPCLDACRASVRIPVVGMGQAALLVALSLGERIGVVSVLDSTVRYIERNVTKYGLSRRVTSYETIEIACSDLWTVPKLTRSTLQEKCEMGAKGSACDVILLGCTGLEPFAEAFAVGFSVPIVMPSCCGLEFAHLLARMGISHSRKAYPPLKVH